MSFRTRIALVSAAAVALAVVAASIVLYFVMHGQLLGQVDSALQDRASTLVSGPAVHVDASGYLDVGQPFGTVQEFIQAVPPKGRPVITQFERRSLPVSEADRRAAQGRGSEFFSDVSAGGVQWRVLTVPAQPYALQIARPLSELNHTLHRITIILLLTALGGIALAAGLGLVVSRAALGPVRRLTGVAENVTETGDLSQRIETPKTTDELGRLATSFNTMLAALEVSTKAQRQLVADASHELRTPLTSMRTNIEVLARERSLPQEERKRLLADVVDQFDEMTTLIAGLIELARGDQEPAGIEEVRLDILVGDAVERARRDQPSVEFKTDLQETMVRGVPETLERAVGNLLDNAAKWSPPGGDVDVTVRDGRVVVRDHGPGIDEEHLPYVFDRFYRAPAARKMPGSGLGLAIVKQVAEAHGGTVTATRAPDGGTVITLSLNGASGS